MIWLSNSTLAKLRDRLRERGERPSSASIETSSLSLDATELLSSTLEYGPFCEAMYLMMSADGQITSDEREVLKGAIRTLSGDAVPSVHIEAMVDDAARKVAETGRDGRLRDLVAQLRNDDARREVAFVLAAAVAFADNAIADEENETLNALAEGLGLDEDRVEELLDGVEGDLGERSL